MDTAGTNKVEVIATAIDGDNLVLETVHSKNKIQWPLKNLPQPLEIGSRLTLELQNNDSGVKNTTASPNQDHEEKKRRLLEELVN